MPEALVHACRHPFASFERREAFDHARSVFPIGLHVVGIRTLIDDQIVDLIHDEHRAVQHELALHHVAQELLVDGRLEAVADLRVGVREILRGNQRQSEAIRGN